MPVGPRRASRPDASVPFRNGSADLGRPTGAIHSRRAGFAGHPAFFQSPNADRRSRAPIRSRPELRAAPRCEIFDPALIPKLDFGIHRHDFAANRIGDSFRILDSVHLKVRLSKGDASRGTARQARLPELEAPTIATWPAARSETSPNWLIVSRISERWDSSADKESAMNASCLIAYKYARLFATKKETAILHSYVAHPRLNVGSIAFDVLLYAADSYLSFISLQIFSRTIVAVAKTIVCALVCKSGLISDVICGTEQRPAAKLSRPPLAWRNACHGCDCSLCRLARGPESG